MTVAFIILFGGLLAPILEVKLGVGGERFTPAYALKLHAASAVEPTVHSSVVRE